jgi:hypothetical protein
MRPPGREAGFDRLASTWRSRNMRVGAMCERRTPSRWASVVVALINDLIDCNDP